MAEKNEVIVSLGENGEEFHEVHLDTSDVDGHPHFGMVHTAIQNALNEGVQPGVQASVAVSVDEVKKRIGQGADPAELADQVQNAANAKWVDAAVRAGKITQNVGTVTVPEGEMTVFRVNAVVFSDVQFGELLITIERKVLGAVDTIVEAALAADRASRG